MYDMWSRKTMLWCLLQENIVNNVKHEWMSKIKIKKLFFFSETEYIYDHPTSSGNLYVNYAPFCILIMHYMVNIDDQFAYKNIEY